MWLGRQDSNLHMAAPKAAALPVWRRPRRPHRRPPAPGTVLERGDVASFVARRPVLLGARWPLEEEVEDAELVGVALATRDVVITRKDAANRTLEELAEAHGRGLVLLKLVRAGRRSPEASSEVAQQIAWGPGPRASQALMLAVRVRALLQGRLAPSIDDVVELAPPVLRHRMSLTFTARAEGVTLDEVIQRLCAEVAA